MALEEYSILKISYADAMNIVVRNHYLHRKCPCSAAFGLMRRGEIKGVVIYGTPSSSGLRKGVAGQHNAGNVIELVRLWVDDSVPKNGESYLIGRTLKLCGKEIVVSFADTAQGHTGVVYQATNWTYTGLSAKRTSWTVDGQDKHGHTFADKYSAKEMREKFGENFRLVERSRKHRYVFINAKGARKQQLMADMIYQSLPYPKTNQNRSDLTCSQGFPVVQFSFTQTSSRRYTMEQVVEATEVKKVSIRPNTAGMVKTKGGSFHKDDFIGTTLAGLSVAQVKEIAAGLGIEVGKYDHLNAGQQRMTIGNALRKLAADEEKANQIAAAADDLKEENEQVAADKVAAKEAAKVEKEAKKAAEKAAKAQAAADKKAQKAAAEAAE